MCKKCLKSNLFVLVVGLCLTSVVQAQPVIPDVTAEDGLVAKQGTPIIDGDLSDWIAAGAEFMGYEDANSAQRSEWMGVDDLSARFSFMWDTDYIYAAIVVRDDILSPPPSFGQFWKGDNVLISLDNAGWTSDALQQVDANDPNVLTSHVIDMLNGRVEYQAGQAAGVNDASLGAGGRILEVAIPRAEIPVIGATGSMEVQVGVEQRGNGETSQFLCYMADTAARFEVVLEDHPIVLEDFESGDLSAWNTDAASAAVIVSVDPTDSNNMALMLPPTGENGGLYLPFVVGPNDRQSLSYRMMTDNFMDEYSSNMGIGPADGEGDHWRNMYAITRMGQGDDISYRDEPDYITYTQAEPRRWYSFIMDLDMASMTYDLFIDGKLVDKGINYRSQDPNGVARIIVRHSNLMAGCITYIDDIVVGVPVPATVKEDFEGDLSAWNTEGMNEAVMIVEDPYDVNNSVLLVPPTGSHGDLYTAWPLGAQNAKVSFRVMGFNITDAANYNLGLTIADESGINWGDSFAILRMGEEQRIDYRDEGNPDGSYQTAIEVLENMHWYNIVMELNFDTRTYALYIDDVLITDAAAFRTKDVNGIDKIVIKHSAYLADAMVYIDDILAVPMD